MTIHTGNIAVLKITWPHPEMMTEPEALRIWNGQAAVRLLAHDPDRHALLLERCSPGAKTTDIPAALELLAELHSVEFGHTTVEPLGDVWSAWAALTEERMDRLRPPYDAVLVKDAVALMRELPASASRTVLLHGDYNPGNVLSATRRPWLAIDPKPMLGDPAYDPWPLLEQVGDPFEHDDPAAVLRGRFALAATILGEPADRMIAWAIARRVETALWCANYDDVDDGASIMDEAKILATLR